MTAAAPEECRPLDKVAMRLEKAIDYTELLRAGRWFGGLDEGFRRRLLEAAHVRRLHKGEWLFARGDAPTGLFALAEGSIRVTATVSGVDDDKAVLLAVIEPPMWFGEVSCVDGLPRTHDTIADEDCVVVHVPQDALERLLAADPARWRDLGLLVSSKLRLTFGAMEDAVHPPAVRLARRLVLSAERYGEWHDRSSRVVNLKQDQLATMLGVSRQTVNQLLKDLEARGVVAVAYGRVDIRDLDALRREALLR